MLRLLTAGESHGPALTAIIEGLPAGIPVKKDDIDLQLQRRQMGYGRGGRMSIEKDQVRILSGIRDGKTLGSPVTLMMENRDHQNWHHIMNTEAIASGKEVKRPRPGHADLAGAMKYHHQDFRNVLERSSARETTARVAAGAVFRRLLDLFDIRIYSQVVGIGEAVSSLRGQPITSDSQKRTEESPVRCADPVAADEMIACIDRAKESGESLGGCFEVRVTNVPPGLGSYVQLDRRLDSLLGAAIMSIPAIKGVEIGEGFESSRQKGSMVHDPIRFDDERGLFRQQNNAGGIEGGMSNGEEIWLRAYMKPIPTLYQPLVSVNIDDWKEAAADIERSDVCAVPAASVVGEAMVSMVIAGELLNKLGGDSVDEMMSNYENYMGYLEKVWKWTRRRT